MNLLFAHDHRIYKFKENYYSNGSFSTLSLERYTQNFASVNFLSRQVMSDEVPNTMSLATTKNVSFIEVPDVLTLRGLKNFPNAYKIIQNEVDKCDYLIARLPSAIGFIAVKYAKKIKKPYLIEVVACPWDSLWNHSLKGKVLAPFQFIRMRRTVKESKYVIYVTEHFLQKRYPTDGNSTNCSNVLIDKRNEEVLRKRIGKITQKKDSELITIGTTAAVNVKYKGQQYIIEALGKLKKQGFTNYEYQLVGGGDLTFLQNIAKKHGVENQVKFIGSLPHEKVFDWLSEIDIYTQPSRQEGLPRALIEAMSQAVPAFGAKTAGIPELIDEGFIFSNNSRNIEEICNIIKTFTREKMLEQAIRNYNEAKRFEKNKIENRRSNFFKKFIKENYEKNE